MKRDAETFELTAQHIALLRRAYVSWGYCETGAPQIDPKRPYGNSDVTSDVAKILGWPAPDEDVLDAEEYVRLSDELYERVTKIHEETQTALQIVLVTGAFEPGTYKKTNTYDVRSWTRVP